LAFFLATRQNNSQHDKTRPRPDQQALQVCTSIGREEIPENP
jgi:hypothetical protein